MAEQKKGFIYRMVMGKDRDEDYARSTLPTSRWSLFWDIFKGRLGKLCIINLLMLLFLLPLIAVVFFRFMFVSALNISLPTMGGLGVGYPGNLESNLQYLAIINSQDLMFFGLMIPASIIAAIGLSGGFYIIRNMVWTEGTFIANDFWRGIKINIGQFIFTAAILSLLIFTAAVNFNMLNYWEYLDGASFWTVASHVATWIMLVLVGMMSLWMLSMSVTYKLKLRHLIKNAFIMTIGLLFQNIFFIVLAVSPLLIGLLLSLLIPSTFITAIIFMVYVLIGFSLFVLVWTNYSQWAFDKFFNDRVEGAVKNRGIYPKVKDAEEMDRRKKAQAAKFSNPKKKRAVKPVTDKDVTLTDISGAGFTRANLQKLEKEKEQLKLDAEKYAEEHMNTDYEDDLDISEEGDDESFEGYEEAMLLEGYDPDDAEAAAALMESEEDDAADTDSVEQDAAESVPAKSEAEKTPAAGGKKKKRK